MTDKQPNPKQALVVFLNRIGGEVLPDTDQHEFRFTIKSESSSKLYTVARRKHGVNAGQWECSCMGWIISGKGGKTRHCKHLDAMGHQLRAITNQSAGR